MNGNWSRAIIGCELRYFDRHLPKADDLDAINANAIPAKDVKRYARVYRYFPTFAEAEL